MDCGGFTPSQRLRKSLKYNAWYYSILAVIGVVALAYVAVVRKMDLYVYIFPEEKYSRILT
jgi:hypothetical protein